MTYKEILNKTRLVVDKLTDKVYLAIVKNECENGLVEISEHRELTDEEIMKTVFQLARIFLKRQGETEYTLSNGEENVTFSVKKSRDAENRRGQSESQQSK